MVENKIVDKLRVEMYAAVYDDVPMDNRRLKRLLRLDGDFGETLNKGVAALMNSREIRAERRKAKKRK